MFAAALRDMSRAMDNKLFTRLWMAESHPQLDGRSHQVSPIKCESSALYGRDERPLARQTSVLATDIAGGFTMSLAACLLLVEGQVKVTRTSGGVNCPAPFDMPTWDARRAYKCTRHKAEGLSNY